MKTKATNLAKSWEMIIKKHQNEENIRSITGREKKG